MSAALRIRPAVSADLDALTTIENRVFDTDRLSRRSLRYYIGHPRDALIVAEAGGEVLGYALVAVRSGTALARLYSIAVLPERAGGGLGRRLMQAVEEAALARGSILLRLEVRADNASAIALYEKLGYRRFGVYEDYYEDHADALRYEKRLAARIAAPHRPPPFYAQTTDFTCGPCCMLMALAWGQPGFRPDRTAELRLWREATTVFMTSGLGGCEPYGIAATLARHGVGAELRLSAPGPFFLDGVRSPDKREVMRITQEDFRREAAERKVPVGPALDDASLREVLDGSALAIVLVSGYRMFGKKAPHWVLAHAHDGAHVFVNDPWVETDNLETPFAAANLPIPAQEFQRMARYGKENLRAAVLVRRARIAPPDR